MDTKSTMWSRILLFQDLTRQSLILRGRIELLDITCTYHLSQLIVNIMSNKTSWCCVLPNGMHWGRYDSITMVFLLNIMCCFRAGFMVQWVVTCEAVFPYQNRTPFRVLAALLPIRLPTGAHGKQWMMAQVPEQLATHMEDQVGVPDS